MIKPIETVYKGYRLRSRLEARWAVFYDALKIEWQYEPEGFDLGEAGWYLPDFYLPQLRCWIEIKPEMPKYNPHDSAVIKADAFSKLINAPLFLFFGNIPYPDPSKAPESDRDSSHLFFAGGWDSYYWWCRCNNCGQLGIEFEGRSARLSCNCYGDSDKERNYDAPELVKAYEAARQARFEHIA